MGMKNRISVVVSGHEFTLVTDEPEEYLQKLAEALNQEISQIMTDSHLGLSSSTILAAFNFADKAQKATETVEHLREQVKVYLDETQKLKSELAETRRELSRARKQL